MRLLAFAAILLLSACNRESTGFVTTHDGRLVAETAEVSRDEFAHRAGLRAAEAAGPEWRAQAAISELPRRDEVTADEWGWKSLPIELVLIAPAGTVTDGAAARAEEAVRKIAIYRVHRSADIAIATRIQIAGEPAPGSTRYTAVAGDTWAGISAAFYGTSQHWRVIADANPGVEAQAGVDLVIPPKP